MPHVATDPAFRAIEEWWSDMGVEADPALVKALVSAAPGASSARAASGRQASQAGSGARGRVQTDWVAAARDAARACEDLDALKAAIEAFDGCALKAGCENTVVFDGVAGAPVMVIGEGPGAQEDRQGKPFVGPAGQLLDRMLAAIGLSRAENVLITNVNYWRPPGNRNPEEAELAVCRPFVDRMIALTAPRLIIAAGNVPAKSLLATRDGVMKTRGREFAYAPPGGRDTPVFPILHPAFLLRRPAEKARAWRDLLAIERRLAELA